MKHSNRSAAWLLSVVLLAITSCETDEVSPAPESIAYHKFEQNASASGATVYKDVYQIDLTDPRWIEVNPCSGEPLDIIEGIWHIGYTEITNKNRFVLQFHTNVSKYRIVNLSTGVEYIGSYASNDVGSIDYNIGYPEAYTETLSMLLTTPGKKNNILLKADMHITIDATGNITVYFDNKRAECQK